MRYITIEYSKLTNSYFFEQKLISTSTVFIVNHNRLPSTIGRLVYNYWSPMCIYMFYTLIVRIIATT